MQVVKRFSRGLVAAVAVAASLGVAAQDDHLDFGKIKVAQSKTAAGDRSLRRERYVKAEQEFHAAIAADATYPAAYAGLGSALVAQQRFGEAIEALREAEIRYVAWKRLLAISQMRNRKFLIDLRHAYRDQIGDLKDKLKADKAAHRTEDRAVVKLIQSLELEKMRIEVFRDNNDRIEPEDLGAIPAQVFYLEGISHLRLGQLDDGVALLEVTLLLDETHGLAHYNLAVAELGLGHPVQAKEHLDAAVTAGVTPPPAFVGDLERALAARGGTG